jgi:cellulose synthase/poly-beta-1,6-N-acetylglucosamine synthase-like glycosyltransferase
MLILDIVAGSALLILIVTWIAYPAMVWALSRLRPIRRQGVAGAPSVSVVLASRDDAEAIRGRVENLLGSSYDASRLEVIVALDREPVPADALTPAAGPVRVVAPAGRGKAAALNAGVAVARGEVIVFADTHQRFDTRTITELVAGLEEPGVGAVSGSLRIPAGRAVLTRTYWRYERWLRRCEARLHSTVGATGAVYAMRRELWQPLPEGLLLDDVYAPMRLVLAGHRVGFVDSAIAHELRQSAPHNEFRRKVRTLTGVVQVCAWLPAVLVPWRNAIWAQFALHKLARMLTPYALALLLVWSLIRGSLVLTPLLPVLLIGGALAAAWATFGRDRSARRLRDLLVEGMLLQAAVVIGGVNGVRGRWEVWHG